MMGPSQINAVSTLLGELGMRGYDVQNIDVEVDRSGGPFMEATVRVRLWDDGKTDNGKKANGS